jgi:hypothetical protein
VQDLTARVEALAATRQPAAASGRHGSRYPHPTPGRPPQQSLTWTDSRPAPGAS